MKKLLILAMLLLLPELPQAAFVRTGGIGKGRETITDAEIESRTKAVTDAQEFWLLRQQCTRDAPKRLFEASYYNQIVNDSRAAGIDPFWTLGLFYIESCGNANAKSRTGPAGLGQHTTASALDENLVVKDIKKEIGSHTVSVYKMRGTGKNRKRVLVSQKIVKDYTITHIDERLIPERAITATISRLAKRVKMFGDITWAIVDYHMGTGNLLRVLTLYFGRPITPNNVQEEIQKARLIWPQVFFRNTPYYKPTLYDFLVQLRDKNDFSPTYLFRVMKAKQLLEIYRQSSYAYAVKWDENQNKFDNQEITPNLMWSFFSPEDVNRFKFQTLENLQEAKTSGRLSILPNPWEQFGVSIRLEGRSPLGEKDKPHQLDYVAAEPATLGCLLYMIDELKLLEGNRFTPFEINSMVRTVEYQDKPKKTNKNADTRLPTHIMGKAFDVPNLTMPAWRRKDLLFIASDMEIQGMLAFIPEGRQKTMHVVPHPNFQQYFALYYREAVPGSQTVSAK